MERERQTVDQVAVGAQVLVRQGLDLVAGIVFDLYGDPGSQRAVVLLPGQGMDAESEPTTITVPVSELLVGSEADRPGQWIVAQRYEREIAQALRRTLRALHAELRKEGQTDRDVDFVIEHDDFWLLVEVKAGVPHRSDAIAKQWQLLASSFPGQSHLLLVAPRSVIDAWRKVAEKAGAESISWDSKDDDEALRSKLTEMLTAA